MGGSGNETITSRNASIVGRAYFRLYTHAQEQDARVLWTCCRVEVTFYVVRNGWKKAQAGRVGRVRNGRERRSDGSRSVYRPVSRVLFYGSALLLFSARSPCCDAAPSRPLRPLNFNVRCKVKRGNLERNFVLSTCCSNEVRRKSGMLLQQNVHLCPSRPSGVRGITALQYAYRQRNKEDVINWWVG